MEKARAWDDDETRRRRGAGHEARLQVARPASQKADSEPRRSIERRDRTGVGRGSRKTRSGASGWHRGGTSSSRGFEKGSARDFTQAVSFHPLAEAEYSAAASFYEERQFGLGLSFLEEIERALESIAERPRAARLLTGEVRCKVVRRFPYSILYSAHGSVVR